MAFVKYTNYWRMAFVLLLLAWHAYAQSEIEECNVLEKFDVKPAAIDDDNWQMIFDEEWMVEFFAPWCPACRLFDATWEHFSKMAADRNVKVGKVNILHSPSLKARFVVSALPTIFHVINGEVRQYSGPRGTDALIDFIDEKKWQFIEPFTGWKEQEQYENEKTGFFKYVRFPPALENLAKCMEATYGIPLWGSNTFISLVLIVVGAILGQLLSAMYSMLKSSRKYQRQRAEMEKTKAKLDIIDECDDDETIEEDFLQDIVSAEGLGLEDEKNEVPDEEKPTEGKTFSQFESGNEFPLDDYQLFLGDDEQGEFAEPETALPGAPPEHFKVCQRKPLHDN